LEIICDYSNEKYLLYMRYAYSKVNNIGIILSDTDSGILSKYLFTSLGKKEVKSSEKNCLLSSSTKIFHLDFS
jgi:hypothetical protein